MADGEHEGFFTDDAIIITRPEPPSRRVALAALEAADRVATRRAALTYVKHAALHPYHLTAIAGVLLLALVNWSAWILFAGFFAELLLLTVLPRLGAFRRRVDAALDEARRLAASKAREALVAQLGEGHRRELARIDRLVLRARECDKDRGIPVRSILDDGLARLSASYIRLALAYRACEEALASTNRLALEDTIRSLEALRAVASERLRPVVDRRLAIAHRRLACCVRARESIELIGQQLATIVDLVQLMHQQAIAPLATEDPQGDIDRFLVELEDTEFAVRELSDLGVGANDVMAFDVLASVA